MATKMTTIGGQKKPWEIDVDKIDFSGIKAPNTPKEVFGIDPVTGERFQGAAPSSRGGGRGGGVIETEQRQGLPLYKDVETGKISGFQSRSGATYLRPPGMSDADWFGMIDEMGAREARGREAPKGSFFIEEEAARVAQQQRMAELAQRIGADPMQQQGMMGQGAMGQAPPIDFTQAALAAGLGGVTTGAGIASLKAIFGGTLGAAAASGATKGAILGPKGALIGMAVAVAGAALAAGLANIRSQRSGEIRGIQSNLAANERIMNEMIAGMNIDPANAEKYLMGYETAKAKIIQDYGILNSMTQEKLTLALSQDGTRVKYRYAHFTEPNGMMAALDAKATRALVAPDMEAGMSLIASLNFGGEE